MPHIFPLLALVVAVVLLTIGRVKKNKFLVTTGFVLLALFIAWIIWIGYTIIPYFIAAYPL